MKNILLINDVKVFESSKGALNAPSQSALIFKVIFVLELCVFEICIARFLFIFLLSSAKCTSC